MSLYVLNNQIMFVYKTHFLGTFIDMIGYLVLWMHSCPIVLLANLLNVLG